MTLPDKDTLATYGGPMRDYADPVDPTTDESAEYRNKYAANVAMMTRTATRGFRSFLGTTGGATGISDPASGFVHDALWGNSSLVKPTATRIATGTYDVAWPSSVQDELFASHTLSLSRAFGNVESSDGTYRVASAKMTGANKVRIYCYEAFNGGQVSLSDLPNEIITVFVV